MAGGQAGYAHQMDIIFHRHARGLILTEQGELLYRTTHEVYHKLVSTMNGGFQKVAKPTPKAGIDVAIERIDARGAFEPAADLPEEKPPW